MFCYQRYSALLIFLLLILSALVIRFSHTKQCLGPETLCAFFLSARFLIESAQYMLFILVFGGLKVHHIVITSSVVVAQPQFLIPE